ncbi:MAG: carbohydrate ABC transporter permease [Lachnospiraceae bacterium]|nr:carbohydrate ABC transporter permease [Lachnospiraceae bacterium]
MRRKHTKHVIKTWILSVTAFTVGIVLVSPLYLVFVNSVKPVREIYLSPLGLPKEISWDNFGRVMEQINFGQALKNSLFFAVFGVAGLLVICSMAAYRLVRHRTRVNKFVYLLLVSSILVPFQTVMIPLIKIMASIGLYNTRLGVLLAYYGYGIPFAVFLFSGFLNSIPREIEDAALIDGGSPLQVYRCIILPLLKPICVTVAVLDVLWIYNDFLLPFVLISDNELRTLPLVMYTFFTAYERPWDLAMASLTMVLTPAIIMFVILQKQITGGIVSGAVKG